MRLILEIKDTHEIFYDSFNNPLGMIKTNIKKLAGSIGYPNIKIAIELLVNDSFVYDTKTKLLIENYNTFKYDEINITICKDIFGSTSLYYVKDKETFMYMFVSEKKGIPAHIIENTSRYEIGEFPNG